MSKLPVIFVVGDKAGKLSELLAAAAGMGDKVYAVFIGDEADAKAAAGNGADSVFLLTPQAETPFEDYAASIAQVIKSNGGAGLVMLPSSKNCKCMAAKLAAQLDTALVNDLDALLTEDGLGARHMVYGGMAFGTEKFTSPLAIVTVGSGVFEAAPSGKTGEVKKAEFIPPSKPIKRLEVKPKQGSTVNLGKAKKVVSIGRGLKSKDDLGLVEKFAKAIGAELGCTRPIAESENWMERERYIGVSGVMLKNDAFVAVGLSGQIQHMVGAAACKTIIAVNKDKNAPVFKFADYGIVGDLYKILPKLTETFKG